MEGITNIAKTVLANQDDEVWMELIFYRDRKHKDEVGAKMQNDENMGDFSNSHWIWSLRAPDLSGAVNPHQGLDDNMPTIVHFALCIDTKNNNFAIWESDEDAR